MRKMVFVGSVVMMYMITVSALLFAKGKKNASLDYPQPQFEGNCVYVIDTMEGDFAGVSGKLEIQNETDSLVPITIFVHDAKTKEWQDVFESHIYEKSRGGKYSRDGSFEKSYSSDSRELPKDCVGNDDGHGAFSININKYTGKEKYRYVAFKFGMDHDSTINCSTSLEKYHGGISCTITGYSEKILLESKTIYKTAGITMIVSIFVRNFSVRLSWGDPTPPRELCRLFLQGWGRQAGAAPSRLRFLPDIIEQALLYEPPLRTIGAAS